MPSTLELPAPLYAPPAAEPERDASGEIIYPESDGLPMAWNTKNYDWLTYIKDGLELHLADNPEAFVAGDLFWYPVEGHPEIVVAPDVFAAFGRPKGPRRSYRQWVEGRVAPQVVFEVLSDRNTAQEMMAKMEFYTRHGVREYIVFDPEEPSLRVWTRQGRALLPVDDTQGWSSELLGLSFWLTDDFALHMVQPGGNRILTHAEQAQRAKSEQQRDESEKQRAESERQRADSERQRAEAAQLEAAKQKARADALAARLKAAGLSDPDLL